ncbi:MAG TPA: diguanylate cyclase [Terriglobia bacterium]|nr:diguanylate cyclase [Terriglobia bacterium]
MRVRFWGTRGSIPTPGPKTAVYGGNTSCIELATTDGTTVVLDSGTGIRVLGLDMLRRPGPHRIHLLIGHTHWDHIQGFPFFTPAFLPGTELNIYGSAAFQRSLEDSLSGQMQYSYFPVKLKELASRLHYTELEEGFFRIGNILVETQYLNHTAPTIAYRVSNGGATVAYVTDHEPFWNSPGPLFRHPGDQRHIEFLKGADLVIHDAQYTSEEYRLKRGWGHSPVEYATDICAAAGVPRLAIFHHDPTHDDDFIKRLEQTQRSRVLAMKWPLDVFAAAEGMDFEIAGRGWEKTVAESSALARRPIAGGRVMIVSAQQADIAALDQVLPDDGLRLAPAPDGRSALELALGYSPDLVIINARLGDGDGASFIQPLRSRLGKPDLPVILLTDDGLGTETLDGDESVATDYLARPFSPPMLRTRVRAWLARTMSAGTAVEVPSTARRAGERFQPATDGEMPASRSTLAQTLASIPLFATLTPELMEHLAARATEHTYLPGHVIVRQDDLGLRTYAIVSGRARVVEYLPDSPVEMFLGELGPGEIFGELGALRERPRSASVIALERTRCIAVSRDDFLEMLHVSREMSVALLRVLAGRLYEADRLLARHSPDPLTGLPGRRAFHELYRRLTAGTKRRGSSILLLVLDVLHLKDINDRFGYSVGDDVLRTVADALIESSRSTDLVARYGGDEFAALLIEAGARDADVVVRRVEQKLHALSVYRGLPLTVECSIGYSVSENPPETADDLLRLADQHMQGRRSSPTK